MKRSAVILFAIAQCKAPERINRKSIPKNRSYNPRLGHKVLKQPRKTTKQHTKKYQSASNHPLSFNDQLSTDN